MRVLYIILILFIIGINCVVAENHENKPIVKKCCNSTQYVNLIKRRKICTQTDRTFDLSDVVVYDKYHKKTNHSIRDFFYVNLTDAKFRNKTFRRQSADLTMYMTNSLVYLSETGLIIETPNIYNRYVHVPTEDYCVDYIINSSNNVINQRFWVHLPRGGEEKNENLLTSAMVVTSMFLLLVLVVYALLKELRNLCGMILMAYVTSLFSAFLLLAVIRLLLNSASLGRDGCINIKMMVWLRDVWFAQNTTQNCKSNIRTMALILILRIPGFLSCAIYFSFLAAFCWMNVMSYDIWWTFRGYAKARPIHRRGENFKFLMYCLYAFGVPLAMTIFFKVVNDLDLKHLPGFIKPMIPELGCFIIDGQKFVYLYIPMLIMIILNWVLYLMTAFNIWRLSRGTAVLDSAAAGTPAAHRSHMQRFLVYLKLSVVMGLNWLLEVVSFLLPSLQWFWWISDTYNILIGVIIFVIFVCKPKILKKLAKIFREQKVRKWIPRNSMKSNNSSVESSSLETQSMQICSNPKGPTSI